MDIEIPEILARPLREIAADIADGGRRAALYDALRKQRDGAEPLINAFEARQETSPANTAGPLHGLPITVKDQIAVDGWKRSFGMDRPASKHDRMDAGVVVTLTASGATVTGKTALPPNAMDFQTFNRRRGHTRNPHDPRFTAGGSSGGGAAAVASGMSLLDLGADLAGSLRVPAAWCGVTSLTPTEGTLPGDGMLHGTRQLDHFARIGPIARRVEDLAFVWTSLTGSPGPSVKTASHLRIGLWMPDRSSSCDETTRTIWAGLKTRFDQTDLVVEPTPMLDLFSPDIYRLFGEIMGHETGALIPAPVRWLLRQDRRAARRSPDFLAHVHTGYRRDKARFSENTRQIEMVRKQALAHWSDVDALILPATGVCAFEHLAPTSDRAGVRDYDHSFDTLAGPLGYFDALTRFTVPVGLLGWPVITLPIGRDHHGLPMGAQIVGKPKSENLLLELAQRLVPHIGFN